MSELFDSKTYFSDGSLTCLFGCLMTWTESPFDHLLGESTIFRQLLKNRTWVPDASCLQCSSCQKWFNLFLRKHHCRLCGQIMCFECLSIREITSCYRNSFQLKTCHNCWTQYTDRKNKLHQIQQELMDDNGRLSDCMIANHPQFPQFFNLKSEIENLISKKTTNLSTTTTTTSSLEKTYVLPRNSKFGWTLYAIFTTYFIFSFLVSYYYLLHNRKP